MQRLARGVKPLLGLGDLGAQVGGVLALGRQRQEPERAQERDGADDDCDDAVSRGHFALPVGVVVVDATGAAVPVAGAVAVGGAAATGGALKRISTSNCAIASL